MNAPPSRRIAIIGAGMAGIRCGQVLARNGNQPILFEKSRGLGGRLATRRANDAMAFDHGAQFMAAQSPAFRTALQNAVAAGDAAIWQPRGADAAFGGETVIVGSPAMNSFLKPLASGLEIRTGTTVTALVREGKRWQLRIADAPESPPFDIVITAVPSVQARALCAAEPALAQAIAAVAVAPCWALMVAFASPLDCGFDVLRPVTGDIAWISRNSSRPGRNAGSDCWVIHAGADWSHRHLEQDRSVVMEKMIAMLASAVGMPLPVIRHADIHRLRYATTVTPLGKPFLTNDDGTLFACGDWCLGSDVESASTSGHALAQTLASQS